MRLQRSLAVLCGILFGGQFSLAAEDVNSTRHVAITPANRLKERGWKERHERFNKISQEGKARLVFLGDSITQGWEGAGQEVWEEHYAKRDAASFGISGDRTEHVLWRLDNGNFDGLSPQLIVIMIGTNNIGHRSSTPEQTADGVRAIVEKLHAKLPEARLLLLGVFPRGEKPDDDMRQKAAEINRHIQPLDELDYVKFVVVGDAFLEDDGTISKEVMPDFLHLSPEGYGRWAAAIEPHVKELLESGVSSN